MRAATVERAREQRLYLQRARDFLEVRYECQRCGLLPSREVHHRAGKRGRWLLDEAWWVALCSGCHREIEDERAKAYEAGWLVTRIGRIHLTDWACLISDCTLPAAHFGLHSWEPEVILP